MPGIDWLTGSALHQSLAGAMSTEFSEEALEQDRLETEMNSRALLSGAIESLWFDPALQMLVTRTWVYHRFERNDKLVSDPDTFCSLCGASEATHLEADMRVRMNELSAMTIGDRLIPRS